MLYALSHRISSCVSLSGRLKQIVVYTKMARGAMAGEVIRQRLEDEEALRALTPEGFVFAPEESTDRDWTFVLG